MYSRAIEGLTSCPGSLGGYGGFEKLRSSAIKDYLLWCFHKLGVLTAGVLRLRALLSGVYARALIFRKLPLVTWAYEDLCWTD